MVTGLMQELQVAQPLGNQSLQRYLVASATLSMGCPLTDCLAQNFFTFLVKRKFHYLFTFLPRALPRQTFAPSCVEELYESAPAHRRGREIRSLIKVNQHSSVCVKMRFSETAISAERQRRLPDAALARHGEEAAAASTWTAAQALKSIGTQQQI